MTLITEFTKTEYLGDTQVENIFLGEYMITAPGDFVKVYLYGLMKAQRKEEADVASIARALHMTEDRVDKGFRYFEEMGLILRRGRTLIYRSLKEQLYGHPEEDAYWEIAEGGQEAEPVREKSGHLLDNEAVAKMVQEIQDITGTFLTAQDQERIIDWITKLGVDPGLITAAYRYSYQRGGKNAKYVSKVILGWAEEGLVTADDVAEYLQDRDERQHIYRRVMQALGFSRSRPTEEEARLITEWVDDLGFSLNDILEACKKTIGIGNPNIKYVDAVIRGRKKDEQRGPSRSVVMAYYEALRKEAENKARQARETVYRAVPRVREIDNETVRLSQEMTGFLLGGNGNGEGLAKIREQLQDLDNEKTRLLTEHNIPVDYASPRYRCRVCQDTGVTDGGLCSCYPERAKEAAEWVNDQKA